MISGGFNIKEPSRTRNFLLLVHYQLLPWHQILCLIVFVCRTGKFTQALSFTNENTREGQGPEAIYPRSENKFVAESGLETSSPIPSLLFLPLYNILYVLPKTINLKVKIESHFFGIIKTTWIKSIPGFIAYCLYECQTEAQRDFDLSEVCFSLVQWFSIINFAPQETFAMFVDTVGGHQWDIVLLASRDAASHSVMRSYSYGVE